MPAKKKAKEKDADGKSAGTVAEHGGDGAEVAEDRVQVVEYAAAIDVAKGFGMVCTRVPGSRPDRRRQKVWRVEATYREVIALMDHLRCEGIQRLVLESTSVIRGRQGASATGGDGAGLPVPPPVADGLPGDRPRRRRRTAALVPPLPLLVAAFVLPVADASATPRPGQCPIHAVCTPDNQRLLADLAATRGRTL